MHFLSLSLSLSLSLLLFPFYNSLLLSISLPYFMSSTVVIIFRQVEQLTPYKCAVIYGQLPPETRSTQARLFNEENTGEHFEWIKNRRGAIIMFWIPEAANLLSMLQICRFIYWFNEYGFLFMHVYVVSCQVMMCL